MWADAMPWISMSPIVRDAPSSKYLNREEKRLPRRSIDTSRLAAGITRSAKGKLKKGSNVDLIENIKSVDPEFPRKERCVCLELREKLNIHDYVEEDEFQ